MFNLTSNNFIFFINAFIFIFLTNCTCGGGVNRTDSELFHDMFQQKSIKAQKGNTKGTFMRIPPKNTRAINKKYYLYKNDIKGASKYLKNPFKNISPEELMLIGKRQYNKACIYCHGSLGDGYGAIANKMIVKPPSLLSQKVINFSEGRIYHIIHEGQGLMGSYKKQVRSEKHRWALVYYIRTLQKQSVRK